MFRRFTSQSTSRVNLVGGSCLRKSATGVRRLVVAGHLDRVEASILPDIPFTSVKVTTVSAESRARLSNALQNLPSPYSDYERHCGASYMAIRSQLSPSLIADICNFHSFFLAPGALLITGLPLDPILPQTPKLGGRSTEKQSFVSEGCLTGIAKLIGEPFAYASEKNGEMIHNICPVKNSETIQSNESSMVDLDLHVENAYFDHRPDYLALCCLRQDHKGEALTSFVDIRSVVLRMNHADTLELQKPAFVVPSPPSHHSAMGGEKWSSPRPLFNTFEEPNFLCHLPGMKALDPQTQKALDNFEKAAKRQDVMHSVALQPGNILLLNNRKVAHSRSVFQPRYDGKDRWLQRVYINAGLGHRY